ncbi:MAG: toll/interleukin-1 receptor domain-containing protein [Parvularculaceae bacterium]
MPDVFISYNREDRDTARLVAGALEAEGLSVWWDAALRAGETYDEVTEQNLRGAGAVVVLWSKRSVNSKWVRAEATVGERSSSLVPVLIEECERPIRFELVQPPIFNTGVGPQRSALARLHGMSQLRFRAAAKKAQDAPRERGARWKRPSGIRSRMAAIWSDFDAHLKRYPDGRLWRRSQETASPPCRAQRRRRRRESPPPRNNERRSNRRAGGAPQQRQAPRHAVQRQPEKSSAGMLIGAVFLLIAARPGRFIMRGDLAKEAAPGADGAGR